MPVANPAGSWSGGIVYTATQSVSMTGAATQDFAITELPSGLYQVQGFIVATGVDTTTPTVAFQPFIDSAGSIQTSGQEYFHVTGANGTGRSVGLTTITAFNLHFYVISSNATVPSFAIPIVFGSRIRVVKNTATVGTVVITMVFTETS